MLPRACVALLLLLMVALSRLVAAEPAEIVSLRAKAEKGNAIAQYNLGLAYLEGQQVPVDLPEAFVWLTLASENGSTGRALTTLVDTLSDAQLAEGRSRLKRHRPALPGSAKTSAIPPAVAQKTTIGSTSDPAGTTAVTSSASSVAPVTPVKEVINPDERTASSGAEITTLRDDLRQLGDELAIAWKENSQLKNELVATQAAIADSNTRLAEQAAAAKDKAELTAALAAAQKEIENARASAANSATKVSVAEASATALEAEKTQLTAERDAANAAHRKAVNDAESLSGEISILRQKVAAADAATAESKQTAAQLGAVKTQLAAAESARVALTAEKSAADAAVSRLTADVAVRDDQNKKLAAELEAARTDVDNIRAVALREAEEAVRAKTATVSEAQAQEIAELSQQLAAATAAINAAETAKASASAALRRAEFAAKESSAQIAALTTRVQSLDAARVAALNDKTESADRVRRHAAELEAEAKKSAAAESRSSAAAAELARVATERDAIEAARANAVSMAESRAAEIAALNQQLASASAAATSGVDAEAVVAKARGELGALQVQFDALKAQLAVSESTRAKLAAENAAAVDAAKAAVEKAAELRAQAQSMESGRAQFTAEKTALAGQLDSATAAIAEANRQTETFKQQLAMATGELEVARQEMAELREKFAASESVRRDYGSQLNSVRVQLKEAQTAIESSHALSVRLSKENSELKTRLPVSPPVDLDALRAQLAAAERKAEAAESSNRALLDENAMLKAVRANESPSASRAVLVSTSQAAPSRPNGNVPAGVNPTFRPVTPPVTATSTPAVTRTHVIVAGDTLRAISAKYYGTPSRWTEILAANRDVLRDERALVVGRRLRIP